MNKSRNELAKEIWKKTDELYNKVKIDNPELESDVYKLLELTTELKDREFMGNLNWRLRKMTHCQKHDEYEPDCFECRKSYALFKENKELPQKKPVLNMVISPNGCKVETNYISKDKLIVRQVCLKIASEQRRGSPRELVDYARELEAEFNKW